MTEKLFPAEVSSLEEAMAFIESELEKYDASPKASMQVSVAFEEMFVNVAHYAYGDEKGSARVSVSFDADTREFRVSLEDSGYPFNPIKKEDPDVTLSADERSIGGLGIFMVKKTMDRVGYEYADGKNIFTMMKRI